MRTSTRTVPVAGGAAAILLAVVLTACSDEDSMRSEHFPYASESPAAAEGTEAEGSKEPLDPEALEVGGAPAVDYVQGTVLHRNDGSTVDLQLPEEAGVQAALSRDDGLLVTDAEWSEETVGMHRLNTIGERRGSWTSTGPPVLSPDGEAAWVSMAPVGESGPTRIHVEGRFQELEGQSTPRLLQFADGEVTYRARVSTSGGRQAERTFRADLEGEPEVTTAPREVRVPSPDGSHWYALTEEGLEVGTAGSTEPDVRTVLSGDLAPRTPPVWEDASHLLVQVVHGDQSALARVSPDGTVERTLDWTGATPQEWAVPAG